MTAFLFPGQGSQAVGMGLELYQGSPAAKAVIDEVDAALGAPLSRIFFEGPEDELRRTINAQPGIMAVSLACLKAMEEVLGQDGMPRATLVAGHSLGEYTALVAAGALNLADAARLVRERGRLMQYAADLTEGGMAAILGMEDAALEDICRETDTEISNVNTQDQTVISGNKASVEKAMELANARGARRTVALPVAGAFHSRLMGPAQEGLARAVEEIAFNDPSIPIIANCTGLPLEHGRGDKDRTYLRPLQLRQVEGLGGVHDQVWDNPFLRDRSGQSARRHGQAHQPGRRGNKP